MSRDDLNALLDEIGADPGPAPADDAWVALAMGDLDEDAAATLRAAAATSARDSDLLDLYDPLESDVAERLVRTAMQARADEPAPVEYSPEPWAVPAAAVPAPEESPSLWSRLRAWWGAPVLLPALALAALLLTVNQPSPQLAYDSSLLSGDRVVRNDDTPRGVAHAVGSMIEVKLSPVGHGASLDAVGGTLSWGSGSVPVSPSFEVAPDGTVLVRTRVPEGAGVGAGTLELSLSGDDGSAQVKVPLVLTAAPR